MATLSIFADYSKIIDALSNDMLDGKSPRTIPQICVAILWNRDEYIINHDMALAAITLVTGCAHSTAKQILDLPPMSTEETIRVLMGGRFD
jgi:hypothetical protein